jgi:Fe-Mn family superoxide dismutase
MAKDDQNRRDFIRTTVLGSAAILASTSLAKGINILEGEASFELPPLPYAFEALEPYIDKRTMQIHHDKHHAGYVRKFNSAVKENDLNGKSIEQLLGEISKYPDSVRNNGGGHFNHSLYWKVMTPAGGGEPRGPLADAINGSFGDFTKFQELFSNAASKRFGSGWAWLYVDSKGKLVVGSTPNQDNPLMNDAEISGTPILGIDVWEHAYYLKYQNKRSEYVKNWWRTINWNEVSKRLAAVK